MEQHFPNYASISSKEERQRQATTKLIRDVIDDCIPYIEKTAYLEAYEKSPHLINKETDPIRFLKYEQWNIWAAAQRMCKYWEWKRTIFGDDRTFRSITDLTGNGALDHYEVDVVGTGFLASLPTDEEGNVYAFLNRPRAGCNPSWDALELKSRLRMVFHSLCVCADQYYKNQDFYTIITENNNNDNNGSNETTGLITFNIILNMCPSPTENARDMINQAMPLRVVRMHNIFCPTNTNVFSLERYIIPSFLSLNPPLLRGFTNLSFHYCSSPKEAVSKLQQQHRIPEYCIPADLGGTWSYNEFDNWFAQTSLQVSPMVVDNSSSQVQQKGIQSTIVTNDSFNLFQSERLFTDPNNSNSLLGKIELPPNLVEDLSQNSNFGNDEDMDDFVTLDDYFDFDEDEIISEGSSTVLPLVDSLDDVSSNKTTTVPETDRSMHDAEQHVDSPRAERCNDDRVKSEYNISTTNHHNNNNRICPNNWTDRWSKYFMELCRYREQMGHCMVPQVYTENVALGAWVKRQRYQYKLKMEGKSSTMSEERIKSLSDIGFIWDSQDVLWYNQFYELHIFKNEYLHCNVPTTYTQNSRLAAWVKRQRRQYKLYNANVASSMTSHRINELEKLGFEWDGLLKKS